VGNKGDGFSNSLVLRPAAGAAKSHVMKEHLVHAATAILSTRQASRAGITWRGYAG
jgi:hypothetical protein